jgi:hypothetical protein
MQTIFSRLKSPEDARQCDRIMAVELLVNTKDDQMAQEIVAMMGSTPEATQRYELPAEARKAVEGLGGAAHTFLGQFEGPGNIWGLWEQRDDIVAEFLCWHTIARLRMASAGRMPRVQRPEFYETHEEYAPMPSLPADELSSVLRKGERLLACCWRQHIVSR